MIVSWNESVPVLPEEIEPFLGFKTKQLGFNKDRFYFLKDNGSIVKEIEIKKEQFEDQSYVIYNCQNESPFRTHIKLTRKDCQFELIPNEIFLAKELFSHILHVQKFHSLF